MILRKYPTFISRIILNGDRLLYDEYGDYKIDLIIDGTAIQYDGEQFFVGGKQLCELEWDHEYTTLFTSFVIAITKLMNGEAFIVFLIRKLNVLRYGHLEYRACLIHEIESYVEQDWIPVAILVNS